jgi:hypothetical protein
MKRFTWLLGSFIGALALCGCEIPDPISNGDLDAWCGDMPCGWDVMGGEIKRVGTWHANDYAVSFEESGAKLSQLNSELSSHECLSFSMVARVERADTAWVELDFLDDGLIDWSKAIPPGDFRQLGFSVHAPRWYEGVRFIVRKEGDGDMVLADIQGAVGINCTGKQIELENLPGGAPCDVDESCATKTCIGGYCTGCASTDDCDVGEVCGYAPVGGSVGSFDYAVNVLPQCIGRATRPMGELCLSDGECESGACCEGACSECCGEDSCDFPRTCERGRGGDDEGEDVLEPFLCSPGSNRSVEGDPCTSDVECAGDCVELECTGLCPPLSGGDINDRCAMLECDEASCDYTCGVETVEVGRCN